MSADKAIIRILIFILWVPYTCISQQQTLRTEIEKIIWHDTSISYEETPGFIIAVILPDTHYILPFGSVSQQDTQPLHASDIFEIGGLSKVFTAELVDQLVSKNQLAYTTPVNQLLPISLTNSGLDELILLELINHRSSFPKAISAMGAVETEADQPFENFSKKQILDYYHQFNPKAIYQNNFLYAPYNYALIECLLEQFLEESYNTLLKTHINSHLNLMDTHVHMADDTSCHLAIGHDLALEFSKPLKFGSFQASEGLHSTLDDLVKFCRYRMQLNPSKTHLQKIGRFKGAGISRKLYFDNGWYLIKSKRDKFIYSHAGKSNGHSAYLHYVPETKTGVVLLANSAKGTEDLSLLILRLINNYKI